ALGGVGVEVLPVHGGVGFVGGGQRLLDVAGHDLRVARVVPDVRVAGLLLVPLALPDRHAGAAVDRRTGETRGRNRVVEPLLQPDPALDQYVRLAERGDAGR